MVLPPAERLGELKERWAALLERREILNAELLALKTQIDALNYSLLCEQVGLPEEAPLWVTPEFIAWVERHDPPRCWFVEGGAQLRLLYQHDTGKIVGEVSQTASATWISGVPLGIIQRMYAARLAVQP